MEGLPAPEEADPRELTMDFYAISVFIGTTAPLVAGIFTLWHRSNALVKKLTAMGKDIEALQQWRDDHRRHCDERWQEHITDGRRFRDEIKVMIRESAATITDALTSNQLEVKGLIRDLRDGMQEIDRRVARIEGAKGVEPQ